MGGASMISQTKKWFLMSSSTLEHSDIAKWISSLLRIISYIRNSNVWISYDLLYQNKILYEFLINNMTLWGPQKMMRELQKDD